MTKPKDTEDLVRVGPGTVMGETMRQYWIPAAMSSELAAGGTPMRLLLLGERLIAFRDSSGRVGVMDQRCPHRCASLFLGRNEEGGIRCLYHGWKFDVAGRCLDQPNTPPHQDYRDKVRAKAYQVVERNGLVWVYMGDRKEAPPLPGIEASLLPEGELQLTFAQRECNWLQALEGDIDTSHFGFLHAGSIDPATVPPDNLIRWTVANRAPQYHVTDTPYGTMYAAYRPAEAGETYWRFANFLFPFWTQTPQGAFDRINSRAWVPMDDGHTMFVSLSWKGLPADRAQRSNSRILPGSKLTMDYLPNTTDWYGRWRLAGNERNDWLVDREAQRNGGIFSGIVGIQAQDQAITESMGPVTDHGFENLGPSDIMIARTRRRLLRAARGLAKEGTVPPGVDHPEAYLDVRSGDFVADKRIAWRDAYEIEMKKALRPLAQAAE
jgi:phthalate 4,5-dioxygenase